MHGGGRRRPHVMLDPSSIQASVSHQVPRQTATSGQPRRHLLTEKHPKPGSPSGRREALRAESATTRRGKAGRPPLSNQDALAALKRAEDPAQRQALRSELVRRNLPLVYAVIARLGRTQALPQDDLRQIGALGLLRAIDAYQPSQGRTLSSFAVPYIRGAIQHELRDRASLMRIPRPLWELRRRATVLQDRRRRLGQPQLDPAQLATALACPISQVVEALQVSAVVEMRSLDAPGSWDGEESTARTLLDQLPDPASLKDARTEEAPAGGRIERLFSTGADRQQRDCPAPGASGTAEVGGAAAPISPADLREMGVEPCLPTGGDGPAELSWLEQRLLGLTALERELLMGHICAGRSWADIGRELGLHPRRVQRRTVALLRTLQAEGNRWRSVREIAATPASGTPTPMTRPGPVAHASDPGTAAADGDGGEGAGGERISVAATHGRQAIRPTAVRSPAPSQRQPLEGATVKGIPGGGPANQRPRGRRSSRGDAEALRRQGPDRQHGAPGSDQSRRKQQRGQQQGQERRHQGL